MDGHHNSVTQRVGASLVPYPLSKDESGCLPPDSRAALSVRDQHPLWSQTELSGLCCCAMMWSVDEGFWSLLLVLWSWYSSMEPDHQMAQGADLGQEARQCLPFRGCLRGKTIES